MDAALDGPKAVEKLPDFAGKYIVVVQQDGKDLTGAQLAASRLDAQATISQLISTRVKDTFAGAQVGDKDKIETYMERCVKSVSEAQFSGFAQEADWWVKLQTFTADGKPDDPDVSRHPGLGHRQDHAPETDRPDPQGQRRDRAQDRGQAEGHGSRTAVLQRRFLMLVKDPFRFERNGSLPKPLSTKARPGAGPFFSSMSTDPVPPLDRSC